MVEWEQRIFLPDGRSLGYAQFGDPAGLPLIYLHGFPSSRLEAGVLDAPASRLGVLIIAPDRPGFGLSDFQPERTILDWPSDILSLADALGIERFSVLGGSGGCPYAAVCAYRLPQRLARVGTLAGLGPTAGLESTREMGGTARLGFFLARRAPALFKILYSGLARLAARYPSLVFYLNEATPPDREALAQPDIRSVLTNSAREAFRRGTQGAVHEFKLLAHPWGFPLQEIQTPFYIWHGEWDGTVPPAMGKFLAAKVPNAHLRLIVGEGHISLSVRYGAEVLETLISPLKD
jgi:pimeloyl-ACP methyl ester carboxylesterase